MSTIKKRFSFAALIFAEIALMIAGAAAQTNVEATIRVVSPAALEIAGDLAEKKPVQSNRNWSFRRSVAGVENLASRISNFALTDAENRPLSVKKFADGEFSADAAARRFSYRVNLPAPSSAAARAHASWLAGERGILMLGDLLPLFDDRETAARVRLALPPEWQIVSNEKNAGENVYAVENVEQAVFAVGTDWRTETIRVGGVPINLAIAGEWRFSAAAAPAAGEIAEEYRRLFGEMPAERIQIFIVRAAPDVAYGRWAAETRGAATTIVSGDMPFPNQSMQLLHEQLRHELFHLWMPNRLALTGDYDWFYEGFAVYQALRAGVRLNRIAFNDYLATLAQAHDFDRSQTNRQSLLESSENRWNAPKNSIYARGMLAAFLCDVAILRQSRGKRSLAAVFQTVYRKHRRPNPAADGNRAVLDVLKSYPELVSIIEKYIVGAAAIDWKTDLEAIGVETDGAFPARLRVRAKPNGRQKDLLNELGYNNWRKISEKRK